MPQTHKLVRDAVWRVMAADFNAALATELAFDDVTEVIALDWSPQSTTVATGALDFRTSKLTGRLSLAIMPAGSQFEGDSLGAKWSGKVREQLEFHIRYSYRDGDETIPEDSAATVLGESIESAVIEVFRREGIDWGPGLTYLPAPDCPAGYQFEALSDGCAMTVPISVLFQVEADY